MELDYEIENGNLTLHLTDSDDQGSFTLGEVSIDLIELGDAIDKARKAKALDDLQALGQEFDNDGA